MWRMAFIYLLVFLAEVIIITMFANAAMIDTQMKQEWQDLVNFMGPDASMKISNRADTQFKTFFVDTGILGVTDRLFGTDLPENDPLAGKMPSADGFYVWFSNRAYVAWNSIYQSFLRVNVLIYWLPYLLPLAIPAMIDGLAMRKIKIETFAYSNPVRYNLAFHGLLLMVFVPGFYGYMPFNIPPWMPLAWGIVVTYLLIVLLSNAQKRM